MQPCFSVRARCAFGAISIVVLFSGMLVPAAALASGARDFKAGPRDTIAIERHAQVKPEAQFAALKIDPADLSSAAAQPKRSRIRALHRVGPRGTIPR